MNSALKTLLALAVLSTAPLANAQDPTTTVTVDMYESCTDSIAATDTVTSTVLQTTCPMCTHTQDSNGSGAQGHVRTTVYTTKWATLCSTGWGDATYTITETCAGTGSPCNGGAGYVPPGYTTTVTVCTVCNGKKPTTVTMTVPCDTPAAGPGGPAQTNAGAGAAAGPVGGNAPAGGNPAAGGDAAAPGGGPSAPLVTDAPGGSPSLPWNGTSGGNVTTTVCPGSSKCHSNATLTLGANPVRTSSSMAAAKPLATAFANLLGGAIAFAGVALL